MFLLENMDDTVAYEETPHVKAFYNSNGTWHESDNLDHNTCANNIDSHDKNDKTAVNIG